MLGWITLAWLIVLHVSIFFDNPEKPRSFWSLSYMVYHILIFIWILVTLIMSYAWSANAELQTRGG